jgi:hypothetical protein
MHVCSDHISTLAVVYTVVYTLTMERPMDEKDLMLLTMVNTNLAVTSLLLHKRWKKERKAKKKRYKTLAPQKIIVWPV